MASVIDAMYGDDDDVIETEEVETDDDTDTDTDDTVAADDSDIDSDETETETAETDSEEDTPEEPDQLPEEAEPDTPGEKNVIPLATYIEMRRERNELKARLEEAEKAAKQPITEEDDEEDDGELITSAEARAIAQEAATQAREEAKIAIRQEMYRSRLDASEEAARAELTAARCGEGLDYDTVIASGKAQLTKADRESIFQSANPGKTAYQLCLERNPALKRLASMEQAARVVKAEPVKKTKTKTDPPPLREVQDNPDVLDYLFDE